MIDWRPSATAELIRQRAELLARIRSFFAERGVTEVSTPLLTESGVTDVHIDSVATHSPAGWLRTSPEYCHKRLLAAGFGDLYELGPVFRRGESGRNHQPEFTLLEWYRVGWGWRRLAEEVVELIEHVLGVGPSALRVRWLSWSTAFSQALGVDALSIDRDELARLADDAPSGLERNALLDWLFATRIQSDFEPASITVIHHYPAGQAALARLDPEDSRLAERFEVFVGDLELANGYHELSDAAEQRGRFEADNAVRRNLGLQPMPLDESLLAALEQGLPDCSGVALGFDRLLMVASGSQTIDQVLTFPHRLT